mgnify:CR=1 FL=1
MLQETHMSQQGLEALHRSWGGTLRGTVTSSFARGVLIWMSNEFPYVISTMATDPNGRYVVLEGCLDGRPLTLSVIYAPNRGHLAFLHKLTPALLTDPQNPVIWGGDYNSIPDINLDRSTPPIRGAACYNSTAILKDWMTNAEVHDVWRLQHPTLKEYSFYSPVHRLYTRLDLFLCSALLLPSIVTSEYLTSTHSDHNPLRLVLHWVDPAPLSQHGD